MDTDNTQNTPQSPKSNGASAFAPYPTVPADIESLPMLVWLRGDEPYFEQFSLDADQAMAELSIKRSRLTQISGKELRVGRVRMGRYVKPVFRQEDLEEYKSWTRPTASHKKASSVIDEAAQDLIAKASKLEEQLQASTLVDKLANKIDRGLFEQQGYLNNLKAEHGQKLDVLDSKVAQVRSLVEGLEELKDLRNRPDWATSILEMNAEIKLMLDTTRCELTDNISILANATAAIAEQMTQTIEAVAVGKTATDQQLAEIKLMLEEEDPKPSFPKRFVQNRAMQRTMLMQQHRNDTKQQGRRPAIRPRRPARRRPKWN